MFRTVPTPTPCDLLFPKIGDPHLQNFNRDYLSVRANSEQNPIQNFREKGAREYPGTVQIF